MFFRIISILLMQKQIPLCLLAIVLSVSLFGQNLKADKIILSDSDLTNLYQTLIPQHYYKIFFLST